MQPYTYLMVNFFTVIICFVFSFHPRIRFNRHFGSFWKAAIIVAIPFILWDVWFTSHGVWWFNDTYTIGLRLFGLPVEEWLFFLCIPFSCLFTYFCLNKFFDLTWTAKLNPFIVILGVAVSIVVVAGYSSKLYPLITFSATACTLLYLHLIAKANWLGKASLVYTVLLLGFFPVNGVLTGTGLDAPIVNYNPVEILNIRMLTIPIEDAVYGYTQFLLVVYFFTLFEKRRSV